MSNFDTHKWFKNQYLKENKIPMYLTSNDAFKKAVEDSVNYQDFEKMVYKILGPKYFKISSLKNPDAFKDYYNSIRGINEGFKVGDKVTYLGHPAVVTATKEYNGKDFVSVSYDKGTGKTKASDILATDGTVKAVKEDMNDPVLMKARAAKMADEKEMARQAALDKKYGSSFMNKLEAEIDLKNELQDLKDERAQLMIDMEQEAEPEGGEIADEYGSRLNDIDARMGEIKPELEDLRMYESVNEDLDIGHQDDEPSMLKSELARAGQMIQMLYRAVDKYDDIEGEVDFPQWWQAKIIKANTLLDSAFDYLAGEEDVAKIDAMIDRIDDDMTEGNGGAEQDDAQLSLNVSSDAALDNEVNKMGYNESLKKSLKEALSKKLSKK